MIQKFCTKRDASGNIYTLFINHNEKTYKKDYNILFYNGYIEITKKARDQIEKDLINAGYEEFF